MLLFSYGAFMDYCMLKEHIPKEKFIGKAKLINFNLVIKFRNM